MKKFLVGSFAIAVALISFAFTKDFTPDGPNCNATVYWFQVNPSLQKTCSELVLSDLIPIEDVDRDNTPDEVPFDVYSNSPHGCPDQTLYACAVGYTYNALNPALSQIERVTINGEPVYRPKSAQVTSFQCCIKKQTP